MGRIVLLLCLLLGFLAGPIQPAYADKPGELRYNFVTKKYQFFDGSSWYNLNLGLSLGACSSEATMEFDNLLSLYMYCNGTNWIRIVGIPTLSGCSKKAEIDYISNTYMYCNGLVWVNLKGTLVL